MNALSKFLDTTGINVIPHAIGLAKFTTHPSSIPQKLREIQKKLDDLSSTNAPNALLYSKEILEKENDRGEKIEAKAYNLLGVIGISTAFITGITSLLPEKAMNFSLASITLIAILYVLIVISLTLTVLLASRVVIVGEYKYSYPDMADVLRMKDKKATEIQKEQIADILYCYSKNSQIIDVKASYLIGSQKWFRNGIILFLLLAIVLAANVPNTIGINTHLSPTITQTITQDTINPTNTLISETPTNATSTHNSANISSTLTPELKPTSTPTK